MRILIPIKQVPETGNVKMDPATGTMIREGVESILNPLDLYAIESGVRLKEDLGGEVVALSMGPAKAEEALREAVAMGCDGGVLISGAAFAGSDTWATSYALAKAISRLSPFDLIICGERATDGDTGQVGPEIAAWLDVPVTTYVSEIVSVGQGALTLRRLVEDGYETLCVELPCLITVVKEAAYPRLPTLRGKQRARRIDIPAWGAAEIGGDLTCLGLKGSPTRVVRVESPKITREGELKTAKDPEDLDQAVEGLLAYLESVGLL